MAQAQSARANAPESAFEKLAYIITKTRELDAAVPPLRRRFGLQPSDDAERDVFEDFTGRMSAEH
jgi:hypothetical protein